MFFIIVGIIVIGLVLAFNKKEEERRKEALKKQQEAKKRNQQKGYIRHGEESFKSLESKPKTFEDLQFKKQTNQSIAKDIITEPIIANIPETGQDLIKKYDEHVSISTLNNCENGIKILENQKYTKTINYLLDDINFPREITKHYRNNPNITFSLNDKHEFYTKDIKTNRFEGKINILLEHKVIALELKVIDTLDPAFKGMYFDKTDNIKIGLILDYQNNLADFLINKVRNESLAFKEIGNYLYNYPALTINKFGLSQFSYLQATKLCELLISTLKSTLGDFKILFS